MTSYLSLLLFIVFIKLVSHLLKITGLLFLNFCAWAEVIPFVLYFLMFHLASFRYFLLVWKEQH